MTGQHNHSLCSLRRTLLAVTSRCNMGQFPRDCLRGRVTPERFILKNPRESAWLDDLQPGDEIWEYEFAGEAGGCAGYVLLRNGEKVKDYTNLTWSNAAPHFILLWENERPSLREIIAVRRFEGHLRDKPIHEVRKLLEDAPYWDCGEAWSYMRPDLEERAKRLGLRYELRDPF